MPGFALVAVTNAGLVVHMTALTVSSAAVRPYTARCASQNGGENDGNPFQSQSPWNIGLRSQFAARSNYHQSGD